MSGRSLFLTLHTLGFSHSVSSQVAEAGKCILARILFQLGWLPDGQAPTTQQSAAEPRQAERVRYTVHACCTPGSMPQLPRSSSFSASSAWGAVMHSTLAGCRHSLALDPVPAAFSSVFFPTVVLA